jgi:hypothetical protein
LLLVQQKPSSVFFQSYSVRFGLNWCAELILMTKLLFSAGCHSVVMSEQQLHVPSL